jgi:hypothetical protein
MKGSAFSAVVVAALFLVTVEAGSLSSSLRLVPYPAKGQTPDHQNKDEGTCYAWVKRQSGNDPMQRQAPIRLQEHNLRFPGSTHKNDFTLVTVIF